MTVALASGAADASGFWPEQFGDWVGILGDGTTVVVAITVLTLWLRGQNPVVAYALRKDRERTVGAILRHGGLGRRAVGRDCRAAVRAVLVGDSDLTVASEIRWLNQVVFAAGKQAPVSVHGLGGEAATELKDLSVAYRAFSHRLLSRGLLGGGTAPILAEQAAISLRTSKHLEAHAMFARGPIAAPDVPPLELRTGGSTRIRIEHMRAGLGPGAGVDDICVSHIHERLVYENTFGHELCVSDGVTPVLLSLSVEDRQPLERKLAGKFFDGSLPSLRGAIKQRDPASGWIRLHLILAEAAYSVVMATHNIGARGIGRSRADLRAEAKVLTLSCLPITADGEIIAVRRSSHVRTGEGQMATGVNGNLEMRARFGIDVDRDPDDVPDLRLAVAREAREELGLDLDGHPFAILGLAKFTSDHEVDVSILLTACQLRLTADEVAARRTEASVTEGLWESDGEIIVIPVPRDDESRERILRWTLSSDSHQPHLTSALVAFCYPELVDRMGSADDADSYLRGLTGDSPAGAPPEGMRVIRGRS